jgi:hypothetical protein
MGGYCSGTAQNTRPRSKYQSEIEKESRATRSSVRSVQMRRQSTSAIRKTAQKASQRRVSLSFRPNHPLYPRAIVQLTCGPVHACSTLPVRSSTSTCAISP